MGTAASGPVVPASRGMSTYGYVSLRLIGATGSASHFTVDRLPWAPGLILIRPRYDDRPPPRATDLETMLLDVLGARWTILDPVS